MDILIFLLVGGIIGWLASLVMGTGGQMGLIANIVVGIIGSALGFWLAPKLGVPGDGQVMHYVIAIAGAALLIFILKVLKIFK